MRLWTALFATIAIWACGVAPTLAGGSMAIRAARVYPVSPDLPWVIEDGVIIVRDGRIEAIGADIEPPADLPLIEFPDASITPGFVAASTGLAGRHSARESVGAGYWSLDAFDRYADRRPILAGGVTTAHLSPGNNRLLSGRGAVVRLASSDDEHVELDAAADLTVNLTSDAYNPPLLVTPPLPPSADQMIMPSRPQRPNSRIGQYIALKQAVERALSLDPIDRTIHEQILAETWSDGFVLRVNADRAADLLGATAFLQTNDRAGYLVGGAEAARIAGRLADAGFPLVYTVAAPLRRAAGDLGPSREALDPSVEDLSALEELTLAIAPDETTRLEDMRLAAATALRAGLSEQRVLEAVTRTPAEILGVDDRVGSLTPGLLADLVVHSGHPLETRSHVLGVYMSGEEAFTAPESNATVVRADTVWLGPDEYLSGGSILIEDGKIAAVGRSVPQPPFARVIDAGEGSFVTPGLIDTGSRLGLGGDRTAPDPNLQLSKLFGAAGPEDHRVARAGVTTVLVSSSRASGRGSQITAVKTGGSNRETRVVADTAAVYFDLADSDPEEIESRLKARVQAGKQYAKKWAKWRDDLEQWKKDREAGMAVDEEPKIEVVEDGGNDGPDPITGTWFASITGGPLPEPISGNVGLNLKGSQFEGKIVEPAAAEIEHTIRGTLDGTSISGLIEIDTGGLPLPTFEGEISDEDRITGTLSFQAITLTLEAERTDRSAVTFAVKKKRRTTGKNGEPLPPRKDDALEPLRAALEKRIPLAVRVRTPQQIKAVLDYLVDTEDLPVVLVDAQAARVHADRLKEKSVGVVAPRQIVRQEQNREYHQASDLARQGVRVSFQSGAADGGRSLPLMGLFAVERGMSGDAALAAMTQDAAAMFKLEDRIGSIAPGRDADLVIFSGHPFETGSSVRRVIVGGQEVR
ncbi:MAG: amidohydrolase family protein [Planctomycetota bacterium]